ncbi:single-stranded-DNA-specific exonuclease RecJ [Desulfitibacter alkalitolerans]|uniref:single-stranded-DNA-specific exonuclease RecJ n=1 Tax=Desulfitibacter alkalitolerans TaxID=264641 RepID=UPI000688C7FB|nr:single-stranded-DNA-specific exonuclease RecJ [Desulfitibacter alkalitolerans]
MEKANKIWYIKPSEPNLQCELSKGLGVSPLVSQLLINRGITNQDEGKSFLSSNLSHLSDPWHINGMEAAWERFLLAKEKGERILIYGDYDVDGLTATAIMIEFIKNAGLEVEYLIPNRMENGYGLSMDMLPAVEDKNCSLVITVDCGINSIEEVRVLKKKGIDVIVTDHHLPGENLPEAWAVINPKLKSPKEAYDLAGVGVAFKVVQAFSERLQIEGQVPDVLDLVALGTVADIVPLFGDNRIIVKEGLKVLASTHRKGLKALMNVSGINGQGITTQELSFGLAPRINAAGRVGDSAAALELLLTKSIQRSDELAKILNRTNQERQVIEGAISNQAEEMLRELDLSSQRIVVLASEFWHPGIIGIVASRLANKIYRPVILIAIEGEKGRGSARSIIQCNIYEALHYCSELLEEFGGHELAAGITIAVDKIEEFRRRINSWANNLDESVFVPKVFGDAEVVFSELHRELVKELETLAPFGEGNPSPLLMCRDIDIINSKKVGKMENHLKMVVASDAAVIDAIGFKLGAYDEIATAGNKVDLAFELENNYWNGNENLQLKLKDIKKAGFNNEIQILCKKVIKAEEKPLPIEKGDFHGSVLEINSDMEVLFQQFSKQKGTIYVIGDTVAFSHVLFTYWKSYIKRLNMDAYFLSGSDTDHKIDNIIHKKNNSTSVIFASAAWLNHYKVIISNQSCTTIRIASSSIDTDSHNVDDMEIKKNYIIYNQETVVYDEIGYDLISQGQLIAIVSNEASVIWVRDKSELKKLLKKIQSSIGTHNISYWDYELSYDKQREMVERFNSGITNIFVAIHSFPRGYITREAIDIFIDFPLDKSCWDYLMLNKNSKFLYAGQDISKIQYLIDDMYPTKDALKLIYTFARQSKKELIDINFHKLHAFLARKGTIINEKTFKTIINTFNELGLTGSSNDPQVDLNRSWRYKENLHQQQACKDFITRLI